MSLKDRITEDMKTAMRAQDKACLSVIRLIQAGIKQYEVDERKAVDDAQVILLLDKMIKQRRESVQQYEQAGRKELVDQELFEINVIQTYLPKALTEDEVKALIDNAISKVAATSMQDMGKVMAELRPQLIGRADVAVVSAKIKERLS
jgi:uncharacterized protein YqeY